ncbi:hypothetical protein ACSBR2_007870 [Camellia fascicularis]
MVIMYVWHYGTRKKYDFDLYNKVPLRWLLGLGPKLGIVRVPGIGLVYSELATGVLAIFSHSVTNLPAFHTISFFLCKICSGTPCLPRGTIPHWPYLHKTLPDVPVYCEMRRRQVRFQLPPNPRMDPLVREELLDLIQAKEVGIAYIISHSYVKARRCSSFLKKLVIDIGYLFLRKNCKGPAVVLNIPYISLIEVGMTYYV